MEPIYTPSTEKQRPLGFYWVRYGTEWQVARYHYAGWFLTGVSTPLPDGSINEIGEPVCSNGTIARVRRYRRYSAFLLGLGIVFFLYSLAVFIYNLLKN